MYDLIFPFLLISRVNKYFIFNLVYKKNIKEILRILVVFIVYIMFS